MKNFNYKIFVVLFFFFSSSYFVTAQPFAGDITAFKKLDSASFPPKNAILFIGSSSFTMWKDIQAYFPGYKIINRGFGGSSLTDVIRYEKDIIFPYQPKQIVIYAGENDLAFSDTVTSLTVFNRFKELFNDIRLRLPRVPIAFVSIKPSLSRQHLMIKMDLANYFIKNFLAEKQKTRFIDVYHLMLNPDGTPIKDIFIQDNLHMNAKGYMIWKKAIQPYLIK
jgi:lysophospholipase L1-like esterase